MKAALVPVAKRCLGTGRNRWGRTLLASVMWRMEGRMTGEWIKGEVEAIKWLMYIWRSFVFEVKAYPHKW